MNKLKTIIRITFLLFLLNIITQAGSSQYPGTFSDKIKVTENIPVKACAFNLADVRLLESPFLENMKRDGRWLLSISTGRLLHNYRVNAGLATKAKAFGGWEGLDVELRGHSLGHVLSGLALTYASTGNDAYKLKGDTIVSALEECQDALKRNGYISAFPEYLIDRAIAGRPVWAPWYTLHKIYAGLLDMYLYTGNDKNIRVQGKPGSYINVSRRWKSGDRVEVSFPMTLRLSGIAGNPGKAAIFYGPVLLAGMMGNEGIKSPVPYAADQDDYSDLPVPSDIVTELILNRTNLNKSILPLKDEPLAFVTSNGAATREVKLIPYYKIHNQRYVVYWDLK